MADVELVIKIPKDYYNYIKNISDYHCTADMLIIKNGTPLPAGSKSVLSNLDRSMGYVLESDHRSFSNRETENGWLFDHIIEWRKMIKPYVKEG
jgi:hypothetical protein